VYYQIIINLVELIAAIAGIVYITKYRVDTSARYLVYFLWFTVFIELIFGWLPRLILDIDSFSFLKDTWLEKNAWIYNIYIKVKFLFYPYYFSFFIVNKKTKNFLFFSILLFFISSVINLVFSNLFFTTVPSYTYIVGSLLLMVSVMFYFLEVLKSDEILNFHKTLVFYVSIGTLIFHLCVTPLIIYSKYYKNIKSPEFVQVYRIILTAANIFMYTCYTIGFVVCSRKNKSY
jgi:hypothetical protein